MVERCGKWLIYYIKDGTHLTFPWKSKVFTATEHNITEVKTEEIQRRLLQSMKRPAGYVPSVNHVHCNKKYGELRMGERCVHLHESTNVQLKGFHNAGDKSSTSTMCKDIREYSSAFCQNGNGGSIYFGIKEENNNSKRSSKTAKTGSKTPVVCGIRFDIDDKKQQELQNRIDREICEMMLWVKHDGKKANRDDIRRYYDIRFHNVDPENTNRKVVEVSVAKFYGCVFTSDPMPSYLDAEGQIKHYTTEEWVPKVIRGYQAKVRSNDRISLTEAFQAITLGSKTVYEVKGSSEKIQQATFKTEKGLRFTPKELLTKLNREHGDFLKQFADTLQRVFHEDKGVVIMENFASIVEEKSECVNICPKNQICDFFVLTERQMPIFISLVYFDAQQVDSVRRYNRGMAKLIKVDLSQYCKPFVTCSVWDCKYKW
ncbi:uncharacterized protein LOC117331453 [Pecten maximus]|uniref:uncharacterized protein LOC117331453 n=1 Tax=Pecten maximus TaxID=6579 RepID=UPI00145880A6|nr:uncharacterized protein LOC117331453 [Pecten maximus]